MKMNNNTSNETHWGNSTLPQEEPPSLQLHQILSMAILVLETIVGTFMNGLMVTVNMISLVTHRKLNSCDTILFCLGLSRFTFMWLVLVMYFVSFLLPSLTDIGTDMQYAWLFFSDLCLWFATWLSTFYCVRIVNIQKYIYTAFKRHFDHILPFLMLASIGISVSCCNSSAYSTVNQAFNMSKFDNQKNAPPFLAIGKNFGTFMTLSVAGSIPPFILFCVSAALVVDSLLRHTIKMKGQERTGFREPSLVAHYRAVKMMAAFFVFFALYMVAFNLYGSGMIKDGTLQCIAALLIGGYPSLHSILLVMGNHKLKYAFMRILQKACCYPKEVIETISD